MKVSSLSIYLKFCLKLNQRATGKIVITENLIKDQPKPSQSNNVQPQNITRHRKVIP